MRNISGSYQANPLLVILGPTASGKTALAVALAKLGVPAHSFSTVQLPTDTYYHTVKDEVETLNMDNIVSTIKAVLIGAEDLVNGTATPSRITLTTP